MRNMILLLVCAMIVGFAGNASAQGFEDEMPGFDEEDVVLMDGDGDTTDLADEVDYEEAVEYGELINVFEDDEGDEWEVYYDEFQSFMWEQRAELSDEEAVGSLKGGDLDTVTLMSPDSLTIYTHVYNWFFHTCTASYNPGAMYTSFFADGMCGTNCYRWSFWGAPYLCVYGVSAVANTGSSNLCDFGWCDHVCRYYDSGWQDSDNCSCEQGATEYKYYNSHFGIDDISYPTWTDVVRYEYLIGDDEDEDWRYMNIHNKWVE